MAGLMSIKTLIRIVGILYGAMALISAPSALLRLGIFPAILDSPGLFMEGIAIISPFMLNFIMACSICYAILTFKKWGLYLAVFYNVLWIAFFTMVQIGSVGMSAFMETLYLYILIVGSFITLTIICLLPKVGAAMETKRIST